jgi:hypothetical protein
MKPSLQAAEVVPVTQRVALPAAGGACTAESLPQGPCPVCPHLAERFGPFRQAAYWKRMHQLALARQAELVAENESLRALLRLREQQLFGTKSESHPAPSKAQPQAKAQTQRPRGQQQGSPSPTRRDHSHLPVVEETIELLDGQRHCPCCGLAFGEFPGTEDGEILEVEVRACKDAGAG